LLFAKIMQQKSANCTIRDERTMSMELTINTSFSHATNFLVSCLRTFAKYYIITSSICIIFTAKRSHASSVFVIIILSVTHVLCDQTKNTLPIFSCVFYKLWQTTEVNYRGGYLAVLHAMVIYHMKKNQCSCIDTKRCRWATSPSTWHLRSKWPTPLWKTPISTNVCL